VSPAPWRAELLRALHRNRAAPEARYLQFATVRPDGRPANRTVVFRGFEPDSDRLCVVSDARSAKFADLHHRAYGAIAWYFPKTREQFRLAGPLTWFDARSEDQSQRQRAWQALSDAARAQFLWPKPGEPRADDRCFDVAPDPTVTPATFVLLQLDPEEVEHLELRGAPQDRRLYRFRDGRWLCDAVNP
jgi:PPOX class probable FMN-dependent enzyme